MDETERDRPPVQFSAYLPADMVDELDSIADEKISSRAGVIREALSEWLTRRRKLAEVIQRAEVA